LPIAPIAVALLCVFWTATAAEISLESAPPVVVKTVPVAGSTDVDPALAEIRVTYSKAMQDRSWSWSTWGEENFPSTAGDPKYLADQRTCVLPVKLEPGRFYAIWLNSDRFKNFKDSNGRPAVPYLLTFATAGAGSNVAAVDRKFVRVVLDGQQLTFESQATSWNQLESLLKAVPDRERTVLEWAITSDQITIQQQNEWSGRFTDFARRHGFAYASYVGIHPLGSKGGEPPRTPSYSGPADTSRFRNVTERSNAKFGLELLKQAKAQANNGETSKASFGPVREVTLKSPDRRTAELLDLDTGRRVTSTTFGENDRETHAWVREHKLDLLGVIEREQTAVLCMDMVVPPALKDSFETITAEQVRTNWHLAQGEPKPTVAISPAQDNTDTFFIKTREGSLGLLQILGQSDEPPGVRVRYKLVQSPAGSTRTGAGSAEPESGATASAREFEQLLNDDQRAVLAWTDRQFRSFFDQRTFDGWSEEERSNLERKLIDMLNGPRTREYYQAINSLAALRSQAALPKLRELATERREKDNRDRWMAIRALGIMGDRASVPELIHLTYHGNTNTRWWAQIALAQLTGKNFGKDWQAWGRWWNEQNGQPPFDAEFVRWYGERPWNDPDGIDAAIEENDKKFLEAVHSRSGARPD
jgi:hypothetical protein